MPRFLFLPAILICSTLGCRGDLYDRQQRDARRTPVLSPLPNREAVAKLLPSDVRLDTVADCNGSRKVTVEQQLVRVGARADEDGVLRDAKGRPIRFFHLDGCWGNPPGNYQQIMDEQNRTIEELQKTHCVITLTCNPTGMAIP